MMKSIIDLGSELLFDRRASPLPTCDLLVTDRPGARARLALGEREQAGVGRFMNRPET